MVDAQISSLRQDVQTLKMQVEDLPNIVLINAMEQQQQVTDSLKQEMRAIVKSEVDTVRA